MIKKGRNPGSLGKLKVLNTFATFLGRSFMSEPNNEFLLSWLNTYFQLYKRLFVVKFAGAGVFFSSSSC